MNKTTAIGEYKGYSMYLNTIAYSCPSLKLYGFNSERSLKSAINRKLKKQG